MKNTLYIIVALLLSGISAACPLCKAEQPAGLEEITHGVGPEGNIDYIITIIAIVIVVFTLFMSVKYLIRPNEKNSDHIKYFVLNEKKMAD